jgi:hypothetical protein
VLSIAVSVVADRLRLVEQQHHSPVLLRHGEARDVQDFPGDALAGGAGIEGEGDVVPLDAQAARRFEKRADGALDAFEPGSLVLRLLGETRDELLYPVVVVVSGPELFHDSDPSVLPRALRELLEQDGLSHSPQARQSHVRRLFGCAAQHPGAGGLHGRPGMAVEFPLRA